MTDSDKKMDEAFTKAVEEAIEEHKKNGYAFLRIDPITKEYYRELPDGRREKVERKARCAIPHL